MKEDKRGKAIIHGMYKTRTYKSWASMLDRCRNPNNPKYHQYGGRRITVCERWKLFDNFYADMGDRPEGTTLDRINNDGNYELSNCRWATGVTQNNNRRMGTYITYNGETLNIKEWALKLNIPYSTLVRRLNSYKWSVEYAFTYNGFK